MSSKLLRNAVVAVAAVSIAWLALSVFDGPGRTVIAAASGVGLLLALAVATRPRPGLPLLCDPLVLVAAFFAQFYVVGPLSMRLLGFSVHFPITARQAIVTLAAFATLFAVFLVAYHSRWGVVLAARLPSFSGLGRRLPGRWGENLVLLGGIVGSMMLIHHKGGLAFLISSGYGGGRSSSFFLLALHALLAGTALMAWRLANSERRRSFEYALFVLLLAFEVLLFGVVLGARKRLLYLFVIVASIFVLRRGAAAVSKTRLVALMCLLLVFFSIWGTVRTRPLTEVIEGTSEDVAYAPAGGYHMGYFRSVAEPFVVAALVIDVYPKLEPYKYGRTLLVTVLGFIPRAVWPDKPVGIGKELTRFTDGIFYDPNSGHSVTPTLLGDFYVNLGWIGIILGALVLGIACRAMATYATTGMIDGTQHDPARTLVMSIFLAGLVEIRSDSAIVLAFYALTFLPLVPALLFFDFDYSESRRVRS